MTAALRTRLGFIEEAAEPGDDPVEGGQIRRSLPATSYYQELLLDEEGLGDDRTNAAGAEQPRRPSHSTRGWTRPAGSTC